MVSMARFPGPASIGKKSIRDVLVLILDRAEPIHDHPDHKIADKLFGPHKRRN